MISYREARRTALFCALVIGLAWHAGILPWGAAAELARPVEQTWTEIPQPEAGRRDWPAAAVWPAMRHQRPLRLLVVAEKRNAMGPYQRIARRLRATLRFVYVGVSDLVEYHVNDKWIEPKENPKREELRQAILAAALEALAVRDGRPASDVILLHGNPDQVLDNPAMQATLLDNVRQGAVLAICGSVFPKDGSPLARVWPVKARPQRLWMGGGAKRGAHPALAGVPVGWLAGHSWIPLGEPADGSIALATGESGAAFLRKMDRGSIVAVPMGPISRHWAAIEKLHRQYDHDEVWLRCWDQLLYEIVQGSEAFAAYADLQPLAPPAAAGKEAVLSGRIVNRTASGPLAVAVHVTAPRGEVVFAKEHKIELPAGQDQAYELPLPVAAWTSGTYAVYLTVADARSQRQYHQALEFLPLAGPVSLAVAADKKGYRLGEEATLTVRGSSAQPWTGALTLGVYDFRGRLLAVESQPAQLAPEPRQFTFKYRLADHGVCVDTYWAVAVARASATAASELARAETRFYKYERWSTRNEYQWSTWAGIACGPPCTVPQAMRLMAHAGMNALGYPGRSELHYAAERWGWRYYNEGIGMNTFSPVIEYENDAEIDAALLSQAQRSLDARDLNSAAFVLGSVGEEAGFKRGWGTRYYWDTAIAPDKACRALVWFLKQKYPSLAQLNASWRTNYQAWDDVKLTKEFSSRAPKPEADGWAHPKDSPLGPGVTAVSLAPYADTEEFYNWYYDRIVNAARRILREKINPVTLAMSSAPTIGSADYDVRQAGPSAWNESQWHSIADGPEPGFGLIWGHFDWSVKTDNMFWGFLLMRSGHNNYWVDVPLMLNNDLTHTRSSFAMRRWTHRLAGHERIILDSRPTEPQVGLLGPNGLGLDHARRYMATSLQVALSQAGFGLATADPARLDGCKIVFAIGHQAVAKEEADRLHCYVEGGGTLVFTPRFASQTQLGAPQPSSPGQGLAEKWDFRVTHRTEQIPQYHPNTTQAFSLDGVAESLKGMKAAGVAVFRENVRHKGWTLLAEYDDHTPAILTRTLGRGRLVYVNAVYHSHRYIQWVTPTGAERQGFFKLVERLCEQAGAKPALRLEGRLDEVLHVAVKQFTDPTGHIRYVILRTSGEVPWVSGTLKWLAPQPVGYDVLGERPAGLAPRFGKELPLVFRPGDGKLLAMTAAPVQRLVLSADKRQLTCGEPLTARVQVLGDSGRPVPGAFPLELRVHCAGREIRGLRRSVSRESGQTITLSTAMGDPLGTWTISIADGITGLRATTTVEAVAPAEATTGPRFAAWGWPSEIEEPARMSSDVFLQHLRTLSRLYQTDHSGEGWMTKQRLGYHYELFGETRHAWLRPLCDIDWLDHADAIRAAVESGETFVLTGEDVNLHPGSGLTVYPHYDGRQLAALHKAMAGATWARATRDGETIVASLGKGRLVLCRESIDAAGHDSPSVARWQRRWLGELHAGLRVGPGPADPQGQQRPGECSSSCANPKRTVPLDAAPVPAPSLEQLIGWWAGRESIGRQPRVIRWFGENHAELNLKLDPKQPLGTVFTLAVPPTGALQDVGFALAASGSGQLAFDVGCDGSLDGTLRLPASDPASALEGTGISWQEAIVRALRASPHRDDNGWRVVPIRATCTGPADVVLKNLRLTVADRY